MKRPRNDEARQILLRKLRKGVHAQTELWDMASSIAGTLGVELELVLDFCQGIAVHADTGLELGEEDLQELLDLLAGKPSERVCVSKPLEIIKLIPSLERSQTCVLSGNTSPHPTSHRVPAVQPTNDKRTQLIAGNEILIFLYVKRPSVGVPRSWNRPDGGIGCYGLPDVIS